jgi:hypothetical protein
VTDRATLRAAVDAALAAAPATDVHTHLYPPSFRGLLLWGLDELLTYHYLVAETLRWLPLAPEDFFALGKRQQADLVWRTLFLERSPLSEACRGVLTAIGLLGLDPAERDLDAHRRRLAGRRLEEQVDLVFRAANVELAVMTNDPFDPVERGCWLDGLRGDPRLAAALRLDRLLDWPHVWTVLVDWGYAVHAELSGESVREVRRFLDEWADRLSPLYLAASLADDFAYPDGSPGGRLLDACVLPLARERRLPVALMIGVRRGVNPLLRDAGDGMGRADVGAVARICAAHPDVRFLVTVLSRENQHELLVAARKFQNLLVFGCWWFLNNPGLVAETTRMRLDMLGTSFVPQHSDARVLEQVLYKWAHARETLAGTLTEQYAALGAAGWRVTPEEIARDARALLGGNFRGFLGR